MSLLVYILQTCHTYLSRVLLSMTSRSWTCNHVTAVILLDNTNHIYLLTSSTGIRM
jgi:hypothetical protein